MKSGPRLITMALCALLVTMISVPCSASILLVRLRDGRLASFDLPLDEAEIEAAAILHPHDLVQVELNAVALVNGERIAWSELVAKLEDDYGEGTLDEMINERLIRQAAKKAAIRVTPEAIDSEITHLERQIGPSFDSVLAQYGMTQEDLRENIELKLLAYEISIKDLCIQERELLTFFIEHKPDYDQPEMVLASHILVYTEEEAVAIKRQLDRGASFAKLAKEWSLDPMSAEEGGSLGWFPRGRMVEEFETAAFGLSPGETSGPVRTDYGYHIIRLIDRKEAHEATFEEVRDEVERDIKAQYAKSPAQLASELRLTADIVIIDPKYEHLGTAKSH